MDKLDAEKGEGGCEYPEQNDGRQPDRYSGGNKGNNDVVQNRREYRNCKERKADPERACPSKREAR